MRYLPVDSFGKCLKNKKLPVDRGAVTKIEMLSQYKFNLAFENSIAYDYVSEKLYDPMMAGSVPVYRGAPNVDAFAPADHSFIDASQFPDPRDLASYLLYLTENEQEYESYLAWKRQPLRKGFVELFDRFSIHYFHRLCARLSGASRL